MINDTLGQNTLVPLILRVTLGVIFIFHGLEKVAGKNNDAGASWAVRFWEQQENPPQDVLAKFDQMPGETEEGTAAIKEKIRQAYALHRTTMPESLRFAATQLIVAWGELLGGVALLLVLSPGFPPPV